MDDRLEAFRRDALFASDFSLDMIAARYLAERNVLTGWAPRLPPGMQGLLREEAERRNELCIIISEIRRDRATIAESVEGVFSSAIPEV